jgi:glyceraldehyde 3-phosphate dehydrogenase
MRIAINGFGRIGRLTLRRLIDNADVEIAAINDLTDLETLTHLLKWDSVHGKLPFDASAAGNDLIVNGKTIKVFSEADPAQLPWKDLKIDIVLECTGRFVTEEGATKHLEAGAKKVILSAPGKGNIKTVVIGVNEETLTADDRIVSNASCTTNCLAPMAKVLDENFGIEKGYISTVHAYTADQQLQDAPHRDLRRARAAALSIIPTSTGAAAAVGKVLPQLKGKLDGIALRVPVPDGSLTDFTVILKTNTTTEAVNAAIKNAAQNEMKGILEYSEEPLVSVDIVGNSHSCIFDSALTTVNDNLVKIVGWYDNEYGYACRTAELALLLNSL